VSNPTSFSNPDGVHKPVGAYVHAAQVPQGSSLLFISGQVGMRPDGTIAEGGFAQADQIFENFAAILKAHQMDLSHIAKLTVFYVGEGIEGLRQALHKHFGESYAACSAVRVAGLAQPEFLFEIEGVAAK
jgi:enamine deaminase RidA (YjgF/YER057c/UK114 family)